MRKLMWFTIGFGAACALCAYFCPDWIIEGAIGCGLSAVLFAVASRYRAVFRRITGVVLGLAVGLGWFAIRDYERIRTAQALDGKTVEMTVIVRDYSYATNFGCAVEGTVELEGREYKLLVYLNERVALEPGNRLIGKFELDAGDLENHEYQRDTLRAYQEGRYILERFWSVPWRDLPAVWRHHLSEVLDNAFPDDMAGFAKALLLGDRSDLDYEIYTNFKVSGISHIIAVSGLHVSILFGLIRLLTAKRRLLGAMLGIPVILCFAAIVGFTPSVTRAAVMQIMVTVAYLFDREYDGPTSLSFAALVMLVWEPLMISSISFQMSFACIAGIQLMAEPLKVWMTKDRAWGRWKRFFNGVASGIAVTLSATAQTMPLSAVYFGTVSLVGILTNLMTLWVLTFVFYGILLVCLAGSFSLIAGTFIAGIIAWPMRYILEVSGFLADLPLAALYTKSGYVVAWLVFFYLLLGLFLIMKRRHVAVFVLTAVMSLCLCLGLSWAEPLTDNLRVTMLDVGQGQAILLQAEGKNFLVDCGGDSDEIAADAVAETLLSQGIRYLDGIILTHFDRDHSGGVDELLTRIDTDMILMPYAKDEQGVAQSLKSRCDGAICLAEDMILTAGEMKLTVFAPESYNSGNESGLCVLFTVGKYDILITGDRSTAGEAIFLRQHELPQVEVLVVGHHGSRHSTGVPLLERVRPLYALISVGENNFYGHPAPEVLERLWEFGCAVFCTDENGTIIFRR